jgi:esterase FrsA
MNDLGELKQHIAAHAVSQGLPGHHYASILDRITADQGDHPGSWAYEWIRAGAEYEQRGEPLTAAQHFVLGRFPFVDGPGRARARQRYLDAFERWQRGVPVIEARTIEVDRQPVRLWTTGLSARDRKPLLIMCGGIVSPKEQWAEVLTVLARLGFAGVVTEMPGVGESPLRYRRDSWEIFPAVMDALAGSARTDETYLLALSFSGHLAIRAALRDPRIRGIVGNGVPVREFFGDRAWQARVPAVTRHTLAHLAGVPADELYRLVRDWGIRGDELEALSVPLAAVAASRDEIIPPSDTELLRGRVRNLELLEHDDVHGAPSHLAETRVWSLLAVLRMRPDAEQAVVDELAASLRAARSRAVTA